MKLEVKKGTIIKIHNKDTGRGYYYPEDDWTIRSIASTYEEAIESIIPEYIESDIYPYSSDVNTVEYVIYEGEHHVLKELEEVAISVYDVMNDVKKHPLFKKLFAEKQAKNLAREEREAKENAKKKKAKEVELLKQLIEKYPPSERNLRK